MKPVGSIKQPYIRIRKRVTCHYCGMVQDGGKNDFNANFSQKEGYWVSYNCVRCGKTNTIVDKTFTLKVASVKGYRYNDI